MSSPVKSDGTPVLKMVIPSTSVVPSNLSFRNLTDYSATGVLDQSAGECFPDLIRRDEDFIPLGLICEDGDEGRYEPEGMGKTSSTRFNFQEQDFIKLN